jgi:hypothetical protein
VASRLHSIRIHPYAGDILLIAPADLARGGLAEPVRMHNGALLVDIETNDSEKLGLDKLIQCGGS